jgi:hypothetical protein
VTYLFATGDNGAGAQYPATSPDVLAVGGTTLTLGAGNTYGSESAWSGGGGGISADESIPSCQVGKINGVSTTNRAEPDVSMDASPSSGVPIYDSYDFGASTPWATYGGTSLATPMWAGIIAIANQGRAIAGVGSLGGATQTNQLIYNLPSSDFHDITTGSNGYSAGPGYDLATGIGTPIANLLVPSLAPPVVTASPASQTANAGTTVQFTAAATLTVDPTWLSTASIATWNAATNTLTVTGPATITADPGAAEPIIEASGSSAAVAFDPTSGTAIHIGGLSLTDGASATVTSLGAARSVTNYHIPVIGVTGATAAPMYAIDSTSTLDLADNDMAILYGSGTSPFSSVFSGISQAYDGGLWDNPGLTSSIARTSGGVTALGYGEASTLGYSSFDGVALGGNAVLVKYTVVGDCHLDGTVDFADFSALQAGYGQAGSWVNGDFSYSGAVTFGDFSLLQDNYGQTLANVL